VGSSQTALLREFPPLRERLPRAPFLTGPTPVEPWALGGAPPGALFVKRDDRSCPDYGGNKPRKLEFILGAARARGARRLVTTGGLGTHHGLATTILGRTLGMATTVVMVDQPVTSAVRRNLLAMAAYDAELVRGGNVAGTALHGLRVLARSAARRERPFLVSTGGSSPRGSAGFVSAGLELGLQVREGACPEPARVYVPVGTGGTLAGLVLGLRLAGLASRVVGVLVTDILPPSARGLARAANATLRRLRRADPSIPALAVRPGDFDLVRSRVGPGYGAPTPEAEAAVAAAAASGLALETTYTGKCLAEILARLADATPDAPWLFWNTYNAVDVAARAPRALDPAALPPDLRRRVFPDVGRSDVGRGDVGRGDAGRGDAGRERRPTRAGDGPPLPPRS